jgi:hypothetical protein
VLAPSRDRLDNLVGELVLIVHHCEALFRVADRRFSDHRAAEVVKGPFAVQFGQRGLELVEARERRLAAMGISLLHVGKLAEC